MNILKVGQRIIDLQENVEGIITEIGTEINDGNARQGTDWDFV